MVLWRCSNDQAPFYVGVAKFYRGLFVRCLFARHGTPKKGKVLLGFSLRALA